MLNSERPPSKSVNPDAEEVKNQFLSRGNRVDGIFCEHVLCQLGSHVTY